MSENEISYPYWSDDGKSIYTTVCTPDKQFGMGQYFLENDNWAPIINSGSIYNRVIGNYCYFFKYLGSGLWRIALDGQSEEELVTDKLQISYAGYWNISGDTLKMVTMHSEVSYLDLYSISEKRLLSSYPTETFSPLYRPGADFSKDGHIYITAIDNYGSDIMVADLEQ